MEHDFREKEVHFMGRQPVAIVSLMMGLLCGWGCMNPDPGKKINSSMPPNTGFIVRSVKNDTGDHKYSVFIPRDYNPARKYPTLIFLHGIGESGGTKATTVGIGPAIAKRNGDFPFIVLFPQAGWGWTSEKAGKMCLDVLNHAAKDYSIDMDRVALTGLSSGGKGTWTLGARYSDTFSALVPMGGYADYDAVPKLVESRMPIWALHNGGDFFVPVGGTRGMVKKLKEQGANVRYTEYDQGGHNCWDKAYDEGELFAWLQQQHRRTR